MIYNVELAPFAERQLKKFAPDLRIDILETLTKLKLDPRPHGYKKLTSKLNSYRIRVGDYRVVYSINDKIITVLVLNIGHRKYVYRHGDLMNI